MPWQKQSERKMFRRLGIEAAKTSGGQGPEEAALQPD